MLVCPHCQTENKPWARFCAGCGQRLPAARAAYTLDLDDDGPVASTQPLGRPAAPGAATVLAGTGTRPLNLKAVFTPRPDGAIFGDRYLLARLDFSNDHQQRYLVNEVGPAEAPRMRQCGQCGAIHAQPRTHCTACGTALGAQSPTLWLIEAATRTFFGPVFDLAAHGLAHPALRVPLASFEERLGTSLRYCVITPAILPLPARPERALVLESTAGLLEGLDFLHGLGLSFSGKLTPALFALADEQHLVWADLGSGPLHSDPSAKAQAADTRALAGLLFTWLTGRPKFAADVTLSSPLKGLFSQALTGRGFPSAQALGVAWAEAYQPEQPRPQVEVRSGRRTDVGRLRTLNEDSVLALELVRIVQSQPEPLGVYAVADGMGGHAAGEVASSTIVNTMAQRAVGDLANGLLAAVDPVDYLAWLRGLVEAANRALFDMRQQAGTDMGSTLVAAVVEGAQAHVAHVGDSRAYLITGSGIRRLTEDHSLVERLVVTGQITADQARTHEQRNVIYRTMGDKARVEVETATHPVAPGDRLLLCSDGLSGMVDDPTLLSLIRAAPSLPAACEAMINAANAAGGTDNISAVLIEIASTK